MTPGVLPEEMKHYHAFHRSGRSFTERGGVEDEFCTALGMVAVAFSELEDQLGESITSLLGGDKGAAAIVVAEMSFRAKVNLFASLVRHRVGDSVFNVPNVPVLEVLQDLCTNLFQAEELRNTVMHSSWVGLDMCEGRIVRRKATAKSKHGFRVAEEEIGSGYLLDIAEFTYAVVADVVGFVSELQKVGRTSH
jgi:Na+-transporting NADH:ubiquinone oxidoreductase subunit NqrD